MGIMQYRKLPHGEERISVIGLGMGSIHEGSEAEIENTVNLAIENGVNFFDMAASEGKPYACYARAFAGRRENLYLQMHFGAVYEGGKYGWTRDLAKIKRNFEEQRKTLNTSYADMGFLHCIDEADDYDTVLSNGIWDYMKGLHADGMIRHLGLSTHDPDILRRFLDMGCIDMVMFSINPAYDYSTGTYGIGTMADRGQLYRDCEKEGVGISVMKPFGGGQLLDAKTSPFKQALTKAQCIQYALDRPAVLTVLPGVRNKAVQQKHLFRHRRVHAAERGRHLRLLQPLPTLPGGPQRGAHQQVLRPCPRRGRACQRTLRKAFPEGFRLPQVRPLRIPLPLPRKTGGTDGRNRRIFRRIVRKATCMSRENSWLIFISQPRNPPPAIIRKGNIV